MFCFHLQVNILNNKALKYYHYYKFFKKLTGYFYRYSQLGRVKNVSEKIILLEEKNLLQSKTTLALS